MNPFKGYYFSQGRVQNGVSDTVVLRKFNVNLIDAVAAFKDARVMCLVTADG